MKLIRVAIFIDYKNTIGEINRGILSQYEYIQNNKRHSLHGYITQENEGEEPIEFLKESVWKNFNSIVLNYLAEKIDPSDKLDHIGTFITLGIRKAYKNDDQDLIVYEKLKRISQLDGFILHFEISKNINREKNLEYGVDANIACQMLLGAFKDQYDLGVIVSNDQDFVPAIDMVQRSYGKKIYHLGPELKIKSACYGSLNYDNFFQRVIMINNE